MTTSQIPRVLLVHLGFHTFWVIIYVAGLLGVFIVIPAIGSYNALLLGFVGNTVLASPMRAAFFGYVVFLVTGLLSGWLISRLRLKSFWMPALLSLALTCTLLVGASAVRHAQVRLSGLKDILPLPESTGRADADEASMALKDAYHSAGEVPPYFAGKGATLPLAEIKPAFPLLAQDFTLQGGPHTYCNLPPSVWKGLKQTAEGGKFPLLWSIRPDSSGKRLTISVDLKTDVFHDELLTEEEFIQRLSLMEAAVRKQTADTAFKLQK